MNVNAGRYRISVEQVDGVGLITKEKDFTISANDTLRINFQLLYTTVFLGKVVDNQGNPIKGCEIELNQKATNDMYYEMSDSDGKFDLVGLEEGFYKITLFASNYQLQQDSIEIKAATTTKSFVLQSEIFSNIAPNSVL